MTRGSSARVFVASRGRKPDRRWDVARGSRVARGSHLHAGSGDGEERETGEGGAGDAAKRGSGGDARPGGGWLVGRCERIDGTFGEVRVGSRGESNRMRGAMDRGNARANAWRRARRVSSRRPARRAIPRGSRPFRATTSRG